MCVLFGFNEDVKNNLFTKFRCNWNKWTLLWTQFFGPEVSGTYQKFWICINLCLWTIFWTTQGITFRSKWPACGETSECKDMLNNISSLLPNDTHMITVCDEKSLVSRVDSLGCLLQDPLINFNDPPGWETSMSGHNEFETKSICNSTLAGMLKIDTTGHEKDITVLITSYIPQPNLSRRDSFEDLTYASSPQDWLYHQCCT